MRKKWKSQADQLLKGLYPARERAGIVTLMERLLEKGEKTSSERPFTHEDVWLITYGDSLRDDSRPGLETLEAIAGEHFTTLFSLIHILPFFPYSSDDGFAVTDYTRVCPELGGWDVVEKIGTSFSLMADPIP